MKRLLISLFGACLFGQLLLAPVAYAASGDVVVNEVMSAPVSVSDSRGTWVELYNRGEEEVDISEWTINGADIEPLSGHETLQPSRFFVVCRNTDPESNGGVTCDGSSDFDELDEGDRIRLRNDDDETVESVAEWPEEAGESTLVKRDDNGEITDFQHDSQNTYNPNTPGDEQDTGTPGGPNTIYQAMESNPGMFTILRTAVDEAGLDGTLDDADNDLTVFAPTDTAFAALPAGELQTLLSNSEQLKALLLYHVGNGRKTSGELTEEGQYKVLTTAGDNSVSIRAADGKIWVDQAEVLNGDIKTANGIVHVINSVLTPRSSLVDMFPVITNDTSPALSGTVDPGYNQVEVRVNGQLFVVKAENGFWQVPAGIVNVDPAQTNTLFFLVACRVDEPGENEACTDENEMSNETEALPPFAHTVRQDVLSRPITVVKAASSGNLSPEASDSKGDGSASGPNSDVVSSVTDKKATSDKSNEQNQNNRDTTKKPDEKKNAPWYWWLIGVGVLMVLWYVLGRGETPKAKN